MVDLPGPSKRTLGIATWLGREVKPGTTDAYERQENAMAEVPDSVVRLAERLKIPIDGLKYGFAWPIIKKQRALVEAELLATRDWNINGFISWQNELWLITEINPREPGSKQQDRLRIRGFSTPKLVIGKGKTVATGVQIGLNRSSTSVTPLDLIDAVTLNIDKLQLF